MELPARTNASCPAAFILANVRSLIPRALAASRERNANGVTSCLCIYVSTFRTSIFWSGRSVPAIQEHPITDNRLRPSQSKRYPVHTLALEINHGRRWAAVDIQPTPSPWLENSYTATASGFSAICSNSLSRLRSGSACASISRSSSLAVVSM